MPPRLPPLTCVVAAALLAGCPPRLGDDVGPSLTESYGCAGGLVVAYDPEETVKLFFDPGEDVAAQAVAAGVETAFAFDLPHDVAWLGVVTGSALIDDDGDPCDDSVDNGPGFDIDRAYGGVGGTATLTIAPDADPAPGGEIATLVLEGVHLLEDDSGDSAYLEAFTVAGVELR